MNPVRSRGPGQASAELGAREISHVIHDAVLQSLACSMLQAELCRRLWERGKPQEALLELNGVMAELESASDVLRELLVRLQPAPPASRSV